MFVKVENKNYMEKVYTIWTNGLYSSLSTNCNFFQQPKCLFQNDCLIDVRTRRFCPHCRLRRCFEVGMKKEMILGKSLQFCSQAEMFCSHDVKTWEMEGDWYLLLIWILVDNWNFHPEVLPTNKHSPSELKAIFIIMAKV